MSVAILVDVNLSVEWISHLRRVRLLPLGASAARRRNYDRALP